VSIQLRGLHPDVRNAAQYALQIANFNGVTPIITSAFRSWTEQAALRRKFEAGQSRFPANRPGDSAHNYGLAFDAVVPPAQLPMWTAIREYVGFEVLPNDVIHGQVPSWRQFVQPPARKKFR